MLRLPATVRSTASSHRQSTVQPCLSVARRLASPIDLPALLSNSISDLHQLSDSLGRPQIGLQLALLTNPPAQPSGQPSTRVSDQPSGSAFKPNLRLTSVVSSLGYFPTDLRLAPTTNLPACLRANIQLAPSTDPLACLPVSLRLAPTANLPASPSN